MSEQKAYGFIHCHSEHSLKDSPLKIEDMCKRAKELGAKALSLTDHGTCTGIVEFMKTCNKYELNPIPGVEAYIATNYGKRAHLVLLAKNYEGLQEIFRAVTESNNNLQFTNDNFVFPIMTKEILTKNFGNGNVIATSACISGVVATVFEDNRKKIEAIKKEEKALDSMFCIDDEILNAMIIELEAISKKLQYKTEEKNVLTVLSNKKYKQREKGIAFLLRNAKTEEDILYAKEREQMLLAEQAESLQAKIQLKDVQKEVASLKTKRTKLNSKISDMRKKLEKRNEQVAKIEEMKANLPTEEELYFYAVEEARWYLDLFGKDFYMEIQNHGMAEEKDVMPELVEIARKLQIPLIASNDSHITTREQAQARHLLKCLRFKRYLEMEETDDECYMKTDAELRCALEEIIDKDAVDEAFLNIRAICDSCHVVLPKTNHHPLYIDDNGVALTKEEAATRLRDACYKAIPERYGDSFSDYERLEYELDTIISLGYAHYTLIVSDFIRYAKNYSKNNHPSGLGYSVGPGRGSGAGSIVNYLMEITNIDPLKYGLIFERYLNKERVSMPDIDTDLSDEVREATIDYVRKKYGAESVAAIRTALTSAARASIRNAARVRGFELYGIKKELDPERHEIQSLGDKLAREIPSGPGIKLIDYADKIKGKYADKNADAIIDNAIRIEGTITTLGVHAAGIIIGDGTPLKNYVPLLYNTEKETWAVQCNMGEAEDSLRLLKMDFLGLVNLDIITECIRLVKRNTGIEIDPDKLPFDPIVFKEIYAKGNTSCVFQFESGGMKQMLREFKPDSIEDIILLVAAYRPGPMDNIPNIIDVKHKRKPMRLATKELEPILNLTYGNIIYQEQVQQIFRELAGYSYGQADIVRRAMSKKKEDALLAERGAFIHGDEARNIIGCVKNGISEKVANDLFDEMTEFAKYAFNRSHAASYAILSYITAWLKYYYPLEYMCSVMNHADNKKMPSLLYECKRMNINVLLPDINKSLECFTISGTDIVYGLSKIKGLDSHVKKLLEVREEGGLYTSFSDFIIRTGANKGVIEPLIKAGAFDSFHGKHRTALISFLNRITNEIKNIKKQEKAIAACNEELSTITAKKEIEKLTEKRTKAEASKEKSYAVIKQLSVSSSLDSVKTLWDEKELLGAYISSHPLDAYKHVYRDKRIMLSCDFEERPYVCCAGLITGLKIVDKDGKMAFFRLEDTAGDIEVCCFKKEYEKFKSLINENAVVKIWGVAKIESDYKDENMMSQKLIVKDIKVCELKKQPIFMSFTVSDIFREVKKDIEPYIKHGEHPLIIHDQKTGYIHDTKVTVRKELMEEIFPDTTMKLLDYNTTY